LVLGKKSNLTEPGLFYSAESEHANKGKETVLKWRGSCMKGGQRRPTKERDLLFLRS